MEPSHVEYMYETHNEHNTSITYFLVFVFFMSCHAHASVFVSPQHSLAWNYYYSLLAHSTKKFNMGVIVLNFWFNTLGTWKIHIKSSKIHTREPGSFHYYTHETKIHPQSRRINHFLFSWRNNAVCFLTDRNVRSSSWWSRMQNLHWPDRPGSCHRGKVRKGILGIMGLIDEKGGYVGAKAMTF